MATGPTAPLAPTETDLAHALDEAITAYGNGRYEQGMDRYRSLAEAEAHQAEVDAQHLTILSLVGLIHGLALGEAEPRPARDSTGG